MRIIYDSTGEKFSQLQTRLRMDGAARMLLGGSTALEAAASVGFNDPSSFYRAFSRYHGCTTREYVDRIDPSKHALGPAAEPGDQN